MLYGMKLSRLLLVLTMSLAPALAQLRAPNEAGVAMGHWHFAVHNIEEQQKFWKTLGGVPVQNGRLQLIQFPGVFVMLRQADPKDGTVGSVVNHVGFYVKDLAAARAKWEAAGLKLEPNLTPVNFFINGPDNIRIEIFEKKDLDTPIASHHTHFFTTAGSEMQAWYVKTFGATPGKRNNFDTANLPGNELAFNVTKEPQAGTKGRSLDHIGFEVKNLAAFCKKLEAEGIKFDQPYRTLPESTTSIAFLTDPWGTSIELTENLAPAGK
jgi:catechol 2,3-dioxygenase-like lactoylglutathione lyase family enzyme